MFLFENFLLGAELNLTLFFFSTLLSHVLSQVIGCIENRKFFIQSA